MIQMLGEKSPEVYQHKKAQVNKINNNSNSDDSKHFIALTVCQAMH